MHVHKLQHQVHCFYDSVDSVKRRRCFEFSVNAFSGWSDGDDNGTEVLNESPPKKSSSGGKKLL